MTPQDLIASFPVLADAPGGIDRLRELVLQLAVRGKLVPQDPEDEPASVLLEKIKAEKARLVREKVIRKPRPIPTWEASDQPFEPPAAWEWIRAEHALEFVTSGSRGWAKYYSDSGAIFLRIGNLDYETTDLDLDPTRVQRVSPPASAEGRRTSTRPGDLLVSITGDTGMVGLVPDGLGEAYINQHIALARPVDTAHSRFLALQLSSLMVRTQLWGAQRGIKNSLGLNDIRHLLLVVPPLAEQRRIVAKVDALMAHLDRLEAARDAREATRAQLRDAALAALQDADDAEEVEVAWARIAENMDELITDPADVEPLRQTILQLAVRGRLVPQDPGDEPASASLGPVVADRSWRVPERVRKAKQDPAIEAMAGTRDLPPGWTEVRLDDIVQLINGRAYKRRELLDQGTPIIRIQNLNGGDSWYYSDLTLPDRQYCDQGDLLFAWSASFGPYIWAGSRAIYHYHIWKLNLSAAVDKRFLFFVLMDLTSAVKGQSHGLAMLHMTKGKMERWPILLPPLAEQHRIVAKVDALMAHLDRLEAKLTTARDTVATFASSAVHHLDA